MSAELDEGTSIGMFVYMYKHITGYAAAGTHNTSETQYTTHFEVMLHLRNTEILLINILELVYTSLYLMSIYLH